MYIKDNGNKVKEKVMHIGKEEMALSIIYSGKIIRCTEKEY
jgi:hypothetical protein